MDMDQGWRVLFTPVRCRDKILPSRVLLAPVNTGFARNGRPTIDLLRFHERRAGPQIGISIVGNVAVGSPYASNDGTAVLASWSDVNRFALIARVIAKKGSLPGIQLAHSPEDLSPSSKWRALDRDKELARLQSIVTTMPAERIAEHLDRFVLSAELAVAAGFDMVQIHAAHGYLLSLLLMAATNRRTDGFGPTARWIEEFIPRLRSVLSDGILSIRINLFTGVLRAQEELSAARRLTFRLAEAGVDLVDLSSGLYTIDRQLIYPNRGDGSPPYYSAAQLIAGDVSCLVSFAGNVTDLRVFRSEIPSNLLIAVGRAFIADSQFARKSSEGRFDEMKWCKRTGHCHYFSRGKPRLECGVNPNLE